MSDRIDDGAAGDLVAVAAVRPEHGRSTDWPAIRLVGAAGSVVIDPPCFLAPMEGITDASFRRLMIDQGGLGTACTDFVRVAGAPFGRAALRRRLGPVEGRCPVGLQLMAAEPDHLATTIAHAEAVGAAYIDLNVGCPAPQVFRNAAGSALLDHPERLARLVATAVAAAQVPVTAKIRVGVRDAAGLERILDLLADAGVAAIALHARRRIDPYSRPAHWPWITRAVRHLRRWHPRLPLIGNGSVRSPADARRLVEETGCDGVMVGLGVLADPFLFARLADGGPAASPAELAGFALRYAAAMAAERPARVVLARLKQLLRNLDCPALLPDAASRRCLLRLRDLDELLAILRATAAGDSREGEAEFAQVPADGEQR